MRFNLDCTIRDRKTEKKVNMRGVDGFGDLSMKCCLRENAAFRYCVSS
jgi:hypothetical protein